MEPRKLSATAAREILRVKEDIYISSVSAWEIALKFHKGKLRLSCPPEEWYELARTRHRVQEAALRGLEATASCALPRLHADPCDRLLIVTAQLRDWTLLTPDDHIRAYPNLKTLW
jgi:PIN domain nuclease of toxin-antitoxin system